MNKTSTQKLTVTTLTSTLILGACGAAQSSDKGTMIKCSCRLGVSRPGALLNNPTAKNQMEVPKIVWTHRLMSPAASSIPLQRRYMRTA